MTKVWFATQIDALHIARQWSEDNDYRIVNIKVKKWHESHSVMNEKLCYIIGPKQIVPDCDECMIFVWGHEPPQDIKLISMTKTKDQRQITRDDYIKHHRKLADPRISIYWRMRQLFISDEIIGTWLWLRSLYRKGYT